MMDYQSSSNKYVLRAARGERAVVFERGENARLWDTDGKMYLDTMSGSAGPAMVGHAHPGVARAVSKQMATLPSVNLLHDSTSVIEFCAALAEIAPAGLSKTFMCPGGGEAVEAAIKFAIRVTGRSEVLSLSGGYHGTSLAMMSLAGMPSLRNWMPGGVRWPTFRQVPSGDTYRQTIGSGTEAWRSAVQALENSLDFAGSN
jgi:4-aminobutyrate aminotransferase-like enzyme